MARRNLGDKTMRAFPFLIVILIAAGCNEDGPTTPSGPALSFFVTSATSMTGNLGGLTGADATCQRLAASYTFAASGNTNTSTGEYDQATNPFNFGITIRMDY